MSRERSHIEEPIPVEREDIAKLQAILGEISELVRAEGSERARLWKARRLAHDAGALLGNEVGKELRRHPRPYDQLGRPSRS